MNDENYEHMESMEMTSMEIDALKKKIEHLEAFKAYVHTRLDAAGIPTHPAGEHATAGCRVGERLQVFEDQRDGYLNAIRKIEAALTCPAAEYVPGIVNAFEIIDTVQGIEFPPREDFEIKANDISVEMVELGAQLHWDASARVKWDKIPNAWKKFYLNAMFQAIKGIKEKYFLLAAAVLLVAGCAQAKANDDQPTYTPVELGDDWMTDDADGGTMTIPTADG